MKLDLSLDTLQDGEEKWKFVHAWLKAKPVKLDSCLVNPFS